MTRSTALNGNTVQHRQRLLEGMAQTLSQQGYVSTTISDIASAAHVSKRTFYEHFGSKQECLMALYQAGSTLIQARMRQAAESAPNGSDRVELVVRAFFQQLADNPEQSRSLVLGIMSLGIEGLSARRTLHQNLVKLICTLAEVNFDELPEAVVEGIIGILVEMMLSSFEKNSLTNLPGMAPHAALLIHAVLESAQAPQWDRAVEKTPSPKPSAVPEAV